VIIRVGLRNLLTELVVAVSCLLIQSVLGLRSCVDLKIRGSVVLMLSGHRIEQS
jgi:hypothetical protein